MREWTGTVAVLNGKYWTPKVGVAVRAASPHVAAARAVLSAKARLGKRARVYAVSVMLTASADGAGA